MLYIRLLQIIFLKFFVYQQLFSNNISALISDTVKIRKYLIFNTCGFSFYIFAGTSLSSACAQITINPYTGELQYYSVLMNTPYIYYFQKQ